jgi:hypothetical protein
LPFNRFFKYDFASTQIFLDLPSKYYGVAVNAHLLSYTPTSVVQLLNQVRKPFFVDPVTFVFARNLSNISRNGRMRRSFRRLAEEYGPPFSDCVTGNAALIPLRFKELGGRLDDASLSAMCTTVLNFQRNKCRVTTSFPKYAKLLKKGIVLQPLSPSFLVAPYFFAERRGSDWYNISLRSAQLARNLKGAAELYPVICISRDMLWDAAQVDDLVRDYAGYDGYIIWVDDFDERALTPSDLTGAASLVSGLAAYGKPVYSMYGGFLWDLLGKFGLSGYSSGICYGESRSVDAVGGGAGNRYYVTIAHSKISEDLANAFFAESKGNLAFMCSCQTCSVVRSNISPNATPAEYADLFFAQLDFLDFRRHFVNIKYQEMTALEPMTKADVLNYLDSDINALSSIDAFPGQQSELKPFHLRLWRTLFL